MIRPIFGYFYDDIQIALFSATFPKAVLELTDDFMGDPAKILVKKEALPLKGIRQYFVPVEKFEWKLEMFAQLYEQLEATKSGQAIVYCNTNKGVQELTDAMTEREFDVSAMHGEMDQVSRGQVLKEFRKSATRMLITTDLLARGIDVQHVALVINYDLPRQKENYIHRIGRAGRFGKKGTAINFVLPRDAQSMQFIQQYYEADIREIPLDLDEL